MKLLLENWRKFIVESNKRTGILNSNHTGEVYTAGLYSSNMETATAGVEGQEVEIISGWQDQGVEWKLINVDGIEGWIEAVALDEGSITEEDSNLFANIRAKRARGEKPAKKGDKDYPDEKSWKKATKKESIEEHYEVDALDENEEYCPVCVETMDEAKKKACKPSKGKRFAKRVDGKCRSYGQAGQAKSGGDRIRPGTKKGDAYCARSAGIKKCKNPPCANTLSRKKWKCRGKKSMKQE